MINGRSYYQLKLPRRVIGAQEAFGLGSFVAFFSAKALRGGPRGLVQLTTCIVLLVLLLRLLPYRASYNGWSWRKEGVQNLAVDEDDGSVPGGLRIVVFGDKDVATPAPLQASATHDADGRSWTQLLCEELNCSAYLSLVPTSDDPSRVMTSTKLYATSVEQSLNLTFQNYGPGLDYNFMLDQFPIEWRVNDLSKQVDEFLAKKKPKHPPAETLWVLSFGMWDIWSLASEPLSVSKAIVDSVVDQIFLEVERLYTSATEETSIAWSDPKAAQPTPSSTSDALPTPTPDPDKNRAWIKERDASEGDTVPRPDSTGAEGDSGPDETKHFRILIPKLFDPSLTPGWHDSRPKTPEVHSRAEQVRNAAVLTEKWNDKMWSAMAEWIRTEQRRRQASEVQSDAGAAVPAIDKPALEIIDEKKADAREHAEQRQRTRAAVMGGQNHIPPSAPTRRRDADVETDIDPGPSRPQRDGILYELNDYLEEVIVQRQLRNASLRDARETGKLTEDGFTEVRRPCVGEVLEESTSRDEPDRTNDTKGADGTGEEGETPHERKRFEEPAIRGRTATPVTDSSESERTASPEIRVCDDPGDHLFYTSFTVSPRAVEVIARQAADMVRRNETIRSSWTRMHLPSLKWVGG